MRSTFVFAFVLVTAGCELAEPFQGPGFDDETGVVTLDDVGDTVIVAVTNASVSDEEGFGAHVDAIKESLDDLDGYVGRSLRSRLFSNEVWTMTVWRDEDALAAFIVSDAHAKAMEDAGNVVDGARVTHFTAKTSDIPISWDDALVKLDDAVPEKTPY